ncbi:MAG: hypothetical protein M1598_03235 [Actinobacteria bacterium]|nr:hypothetical protein [Actinomycetota bacterium]
MDITLLALAIVASFAVAWLTVVKRDPERVYQPRLFITVALMGVILAAFLAGLSTLWELMVYHFL